MMPLKEVSPTSLLRRCPILIEPGGFLWLLGTLLAPFELVILMFVVLALVISTPYDGWLLFVRT